MFDIWHQKLNVKSSFCCLTNLGVCLNKTLFISAREIVLILVLFSTKGDLC